MPQRRTQIYLDPPFANHLTLFEPACHISDDAFYGL